MKLFSRKALTATIAAAAISTASLTAPAFAEPAPAETATNTEAAAPAGSADFIAGSSAAPAKEGETKDKDPMEIIKVLTGVVGLISTIIGLVKNLDFFKGFKLF